MLGFSSPLRHRDSSSLKLLLDNFDPRIGDLLPTSLSPGLLGCFPSMLLLQGHPTLTSDLPVTSLSAPSGQRGGQNSAKAWPSCQGGRGCKCFSECVCVSMCMGGLCPPARAYPGGSSTELAGCPFPFGVAGGKASKVTERAAGVMPAWGV